MGEISIPENCFGISANDALLIDFRGSSSTFYHRVKHNHEYITDTALERHFPDLL
jgi:hypothetical protein